MYGDAINLNDNTTPSVAFRYGVNYSLGNLSCRVLMLPALTILAIGIISLIIGMPAGFSAIALSYGGLVFIATGIGMYLFYRGKQLARKKFPDLVSQTWFWNVSSSGQAITAQSKQADLIKIGMEYGSGRFLSLALLAVGVMAITFGAPTVHTSSHFLGPLLLGVGLTAILAGAFAHYKLDQIKRKLNMTFADFPQQTLVSDALASLWQRLCRQNQPVANG